MDAWSDKQRLEALKETERERFRLAQKEGRDGPYKIAALKDLADLTSSRPTTVADSSRAFLAGMEQAAVEAPVPARSVDEYNAEVAAVLAAVADLMDDRSANNERLLARLKSTIADKAAEKDPRFADFLKEVEAQRAWDEERKLLKKMADEGPYKEYTFGKSTSPNTDTDVHSRTPETYPVYSRTPETHYERYDDDRPVPPLGSSLSKAMESLYEEKIRTSLSDYMPRKKGS